MIGATNVKLLIMLTQNSFKIKLCKKFTQIYYEILTLDYCEIIR
jgi:hypothetical protein